MKFDVIKPIKCEIDEDFENQVYVFFTNEMYNVNKTK